ncbi:MAG: threonine synthase [Solirubrobacteraceae bacterium]|nr:threonine synthase [Solirubrobacteraceae bacterium]
MSATALTCRECSAEYPLEARFVCSRCFGPLEVAYAPFGAGSDVDAIRRRIQAGPRSIWRYADFLPLDAGAPAGSGEFSTGGGLPAGATPLVKADRLAEALGLREVWVKNDAANPTHSFKDRVVAVAAARAKELGFTTLACASTGNLAGAVAAAGAAYGLPTYVFIPSDLEEQKILSTGAYGANVVTIRGNYDDVNRLCTEIAGEHEDWAFVNVNMRPYYAEGSKTLAYEIAEQLGWRAPDRIVAPIASGSLFTKIGKGFKEWLDLGLITGSSVTADGLPRMSGAQAEGCNPVAAAYAAGTDVCRPVKPDTIAKSLAIGNPADGPYAVELARATDGTIDDVTDEEIRHGIRLLAETTGIFTETAGGVTTATLRKLAESGRIDPDERVVLVITGDGLKTLDAVRGTFECTEIDARYEQFEERVQPRTEVTV